MSIRSVKRDLFWVLALTSICVGLPSFIYAAPQYSVSGEYRGNPGIVYVGNGQGSAHYETDNGTVYQGNYTYQNGNNFSAGGSYTTSSGTNARGQLIRQPGQHIGNGYYQAADGTVYQGGYNYRNSNHFTAGGRYRSSDGYEYGGQLTRNGNQTVVGGQYTQPGTVPGTQEQYSGQVDFNGRHSNAQAGLQVYDTSGRVHLGGGNARLDRNGYHQNRTAGIANVRMTTNGGVRYDGVNSSVYYGENRQVGGIGGFRYGGGLSRTGAQGSAGASFAGNRIGATATVSQNGARVNVQSSQVDWSRVRNNVRNALVQTQQQIQRQKAYQRQVAYQQQLQQARAQQIRAAQVAQQQAAIRAQQYQRQLAQQRQRAIQHSQNFGRNIQSTGRRIDNGVRNVGGKVSSGFKGMF